MAPPRASEGHGSGSEGKRQRLMSAPQHAFASTASTIAAISAAALGLILAAAATLGYVGLRVRATRSDRLFEELTALAREQLRMRVILVTVQKSNGADDVSIKVLPLGEIEAQFGMISDYHKSPPAE